MGVQLTALVESRLAVYNGIEDHTYDEVLVPSLFPHVRFPSSQYRGKLHASKQHHPLYGLQYGIISYSNGDLIELT